jgi:predicted ATP-grasp superfamily ATP-dependent carboligase
MTMIGAIISTHGVKWRGFALIGVAPTKKVLSVTTSVSGSAYVPGPMLITIGMAKVGSTVSRYFRAVRIVLKGRVIVPLLPGSSDPSLLT